VLEGRKAEHRDFVVSEFEEHYIVVTRRWKVEFNPRVRPMLLFDRQNDPDERNDLSREPDMQTVCAELAELLEAFLARTPTREGVFIAKQRRRRD
jgi:hypothetical protein